MKLLFILPLCVLLLAGCLGRGISDAHVEQGALISKAIVELEALREADRQDDWTNFQKRMEIVEAYKLEKAADENGNVPIAVLEQIRADRKVAEDITIERYNRKAAKWAEAISKLKAALDLHEAVGSWISLGGLLPW